MVTMPVLSSFRAFMLETANGSEKENSEDFNIDMPAITCIIKSKMHANR